MTLTQEQRESFRIAQAIDNQFDLRHEPREKQLYWADLEDGDVVQTHEDLADFVTAHGKPDRTITLDERDLHVWTRVQMEFGKSRGALYMMPFDGVAATYFSGQK